MKWTLFSIGSLAGSAAALEDGEEEGTHLILDSSLQGQYVTIGNTRMCWRPGDWPCLL
jgi:hypothetical protein